jgi:hypothetical protein
MQGKCRKVQLAHPGREKPHGKVNRRIGYLDRLPKYKLSHHPLVRGQASLVLVECQIMTSLKQAGSEDFNISGDWG